MTLTLLSLIEIKLKSYTLRLKCCVDSAGRSSPSNATQSKKRNYPNRNLHQRSLCQPVQDTGWPTELYLGI